MTSAPQKEQYVRSLTTAAAHGGAPRPAAVRRFGLGLVRDAMAGALTGSAHRPNAELPVGWFQVAGRPLMSGEVAGGVDARADRIDASAVGRVIAGPAGIFSVMTKQHRGKRLWVNPYSVVVAGESKPYIAAAECAADELTCALHDRLPWAPAAHPVIEFLNAKEIAIRKAPTRVVVLDGTDLRAWLIERTPRLDPQQVALIAEAMRELTVEPLPLVGMPRAS